MGRDRLMASVEYLIDTSALQRSHQPAVSEVLAGLAVRRAGGLTSPVLFEIGYSARSADHRLAVLDALSAFPAIDTVEADQRRALEVQHLLASTGRHRGLSLVDALVAAAAERTGLSVLHYDRDFERIAEVTGQRQEWVVARGTAD